MKDETKIERQKEIRRQIANGEIKTNEQNTEGAEPAIEPAIEPASNWSDDDEEEEGELKDNDSTSKGKEHKAKPLAKRRKLE